MCRRNGMEKAQKTWEPSEEELAQILAEMQPIVDEFARRDRQLLQAGTQK